jgi:hypothetical protein
VLPQNEKALAAEAAFQPDNYYKTFGNHDLIWKNKWDAERLLKKYFSLPLNIYEGIILKAMINDEPLHIFCTHGHQGDKMSDNNGFSTWIVAHIWAPIQRYLRKNVLLITGHTHNPVFASGRYSDHPSNTIEQEGREKLRPVYFNTGCCCFSDGDITGIEIADGFIRLIKWYTENDASKRKVLEEVKMEHLLKDL